MVCLLGQSSAQFFSFFKNQSLSYYYPASHSYDFTYYITAFIHVISDEVY